MHSLVIELIGVLTKVGGIKIVMKALKALSDTSGDIGFFNLSTMTISWSEHIKSPMPFQLKKFMNNFTIV